MSMRKLSKAFGVYIRFCLFVNIVDDCQHFNDMLCSHHIVHVRWQQQQAIHYDHLRGDQKHHVQDYLRYNLLLMIDSIDICPQSYF